MWGRISSPFRAVALCCLLIASCAQLDPASPFPFSSGNCDGGNTGRSVVSGITSPPQSLWNTSLIAYCAPVLSDGILYAWDSATSTARGFNASSGAAIWTSAVYATVQNNQQFFGGCGALTSSALLFSDNPGYGMSFSIRALDKATGALLWTSSPMSASNPSERASSVPLVGPANVVAMSTTLGALYALDGATGAPLWSNSQLVYTGCYGSAWGALVAVSTSTNAFFGWTFNNCQNVGVVFAANAATGALVWTGAFNGNNYYASFALVDSAQILYVAGQAKGVVGFSATTGATVWQSATFPVLISASSLSVSGSALYFCASSSMGGGYYQNNIFYDGSGSQGACGVDGGGRQLALESAKSKRPHDIERRL